jgi:hypothetical protein
MSWRSFACTCIIDGSDVQGVVASMACSAWRAQLELLEDQHLSNELTLIASIETEDLM